MNQTDLNNFVRKIFDQYKPKHKNIICHDNNTTYKHRELVNLVCEWCIRNKLIFYTRAFLKGGEIADIVIPELTFPIIEIRDSEKKKNKEYLSIYNGLRKFIDVDDPYKLL